jgi:hypothetical protein
MVHNKHLTIHWRFTGREKCATKPSDIQKKGEPLSRPDKGQLLIEGETKTKGRILTTHPNPLPHACVGNPEEQECLLGRPQDGRGGEICSLRQAGHGVPRKVIECNKQCHNVYPTQMIACLHGACALLAVVQLGWPCMHRTLSPDPEHLA